EQVRNTIEFITQTSQRGGYKVVIFRPAESMNTNSANALLKVLEEPAQNTLIILVSHQPALLMATIRSRCHAVKFNRPSAEKVIPWLEAKNIYASPAELLRMANNIPLRALQFADDEALQDRTVLHGVMEKLLSGEMDISLAAKSCEDFSLQDNIEGMLLCTSDILAHVQASSGNNQSSLHDHDLQHLAKHFQSRTTLQALHEFYRELLQAKRAALSTSNPNPALVVETLFYHWAQTARG
ncbi:MAG: DNA polymerase III subunit delta' C-terminal domain-containing protein, partial [Gammaproteobacteria bacterium]